MFKSPPPHHQYLKVKGRKEGKNMSETIYDIEIFQGTSYFLAKILAHTSKEKPIREYKTNTLEELLENIAKDILEDNE